MVQSYYLLREKVGGVTSGLILTVEIFTRTLKASGIQGDSIQGIANIQSKLANRHAKTKEALASSDKGTYTTSYQEGLVDLQALCGELYTLLNTMAPIVPADLSSTLQETLEQAKWSQNFVSERLQTLDEDLNKEWPGDAALTETQIPE